MHGATIRFIVHKNKFVPVHVVKAYRGLELYLYSFLTLILDEVYWTTLLPGTLVWEGLTGCTNLLEFLENRKISWLCWDSNTESCSMQLNFVYELHHLGFYVLYRMSLKYWTKIQELFLHIRRNKISHKCSEMNGF